MNSFPMESVLLYVRSLYWNSKSGMCYVDKNNVTESCDFTNIGIKSSLINLIDNYN